MKIYIVFFNDGENEPTIEKVFLKEQDAIFYCDKMNDKLAFNLYHYEEHDAE